MLDKHNCLTKGGFLCFDIDKGGRIVYYISNDMYHMIYDRFCKGVCIMPPIPKIKKEDLLECAYKIAEEKGIAAVTSRNVAELAGCSIQPVFSHFPTMEELRKATFDYACHKLMDEILQHENQPDFLQFTNQWVLALARKRPNLFELLYLSNSFSKAGLWETMLEWECNQKAIAMFSEKCGVSETEIKDLFLRCFYMLFE